ncbi:MAG: methyltransferase domain-containing protein, partial [Candidatus Latescibacteria bacterium]|nr:methyltransferase domain-containing protein [Candidatus Latescibacterota bacterium]
QDRKRILDYQSEIAQDEDLPILSSFSYLESADAFGCGAGITHLYIDGNGEVSPCNLVPMSFGTIKNESLHEILGNMGKHFRTPRTGCIGHILSTHIPEGNLPTSPEISQYICGKYLPENHDVPRFFTIKADAEGEVGHNELKSAYNKVHGSYDEFWVTEAGKPVVELIDKLLLTGKEKVFEAGCGTGYATVRIAEKLDNPSQITAVDLSGGMLTEARGRAAKEDFNSIHFIEGDALDVLKKSQGYDVIFTSWVLGYIPLRPFWTAASKALGYNGRLAFIVHKENSPREPLEIFGELVAENPSILEKKVEFDFPPDMEYVQSQLKSAGLKIDFIGEGSVVFRYGTPEKVLDHLLKSGAGTAFYEAVVPSMRQEQERKFISIFRERNLDKAKFEVTHDYIICIARKRQ